MSSRPLRFLALVLGGWICVRAALLAPGWPPAPHPASPSPAAAVRSLPPAAAAAAAPSLPGPEATAAGAGPGRPPADREPPVLLRPEPTALARAPSGLVAAVPAAAFATRALPEPGSPPARRAAAARRWSVSAWAVVREEPDGATLAPGGTLGGSQTGMRIRYALGERLALSGRVYAPLPRLRGSEVAAGLEWRPVAAISVAILAERRQALGREGRSAFSVTIHGGADRALPGGFRLHAYAQAGVVGLRSRDAFVDGAARVAAPVGPVEIGGGLWGAAQPGASRLDAGPSLSWRLPIRGANLRVAADWRFRLAGGAAPGSGPALTLAADF